MALDFPASPTVGQNYTVGNIFWTWDGTKWVMSSILSGPFLPIAGGTLFGPLILAADPAVALGASTKQYVDNTTVAVAGGTMTGPLVLSANPTVALGAATKQYIDALPVAVNPNRIDNGDMYVDQHNGGAAVVVPATSLIYCPDRFSVSNAQATSRFNVGQNLAAITTKAPGFPYFLGIQSTSAYTSAAAASFYIQHGIEADAIGDLGEGVAGAQPFTVSFWARSSLTGNFSFGVQSGAPATTGGIWRAYVTTFALPTANTWTKISITIPGDTGGSGNQWPNAGNGPGMYLLWDFGSGTNVQTSTLNAWQGVAANPYAAAGAVHVTGTNNATYAITGVKLEAGSIATAFTIESLQDRWARCLRYFTYLSARMLFGWNTTGNVVYGTFEYPVEMRAVPSVILSNQNYNNANNLLLNMAVQSSAMMVLTIANGANSGYSTFNIAASAEI